jgi:folate-binding protein YgfZ
MDDTLRADGAVYADSYLGPLPQDFGSVDDEYRALRTGVGVCYLGEAGYVEMAGRQRGEFLNRLATNSVDKIVPGQGKEAFLADANGRIIEHILVFAEDERLIVRTVRGRGDSLAKYLDYYLIREDVQLAERSTQWRDIIVAGPDADDLLAEVAAIEMPKGRLEHIAIPWWGKTVAFRRLTDAHYGMFILTAEFDLLPDLWRTLRNAGAEACGLAAWDAVRIEEGWPHYGLDITQKNVPQEVGRDQQAICFDKGCYIGQETVAKIDARDGLQQVLCGVVIQSQSEPAANSAMTCDGQNVGRITSSRWSPGRAAVVALAYLSRDFHTPGTKLQSASGSALVLQLPMR